MGVEDKTYMNSKGKRTYPRGNNRRPGLVDPAGRMNQLWVQDQAAANEVQAPFLVTGVKKSERQQPNLPLDYKDSLEDRT
jgi:hypothetical protein